MLDWYEISEATPSVFGDPRVKPQGQDGTPFFSYYDNERSLSFVWNGEYEQHVTVCHGGAGEPEKWTFDFLKLWRGFYNRDSDEIPHLSSGREFVHAAAHFRLACEHWIEMMENDEPPEDDTIYRSCFDESNKNWTRDAQLNILFVKGVENHMNNLLRKNGHLFLNEVYDALGFQRTTDGAIKGWLLSNGDHIHLRYSLDPEDASFWITFEPDGAIYDKL